MESKQTPHSRVLLHDATAAGGGSPLGFPALLQITSYHRNTTEEVQALTLNNNNNDKVVLLLVYLKFHIHRKAINSTRRSPFP